ncbi:MAG: class I SAM-dependent methyltransferase [archaeon]
MGVLKGHFVGKGLDIGADNGRHLYLMPKGSVGLDFYTDYFKEFETKGYQTAKVDLDKGPLPFNGGDFDFVLCSHTLEHVQRPNTLVKDIYRILKKRGKLIIGVPNALCIHTDFYSKRWPFHINVYDGVTLKKLLLKEGFRIKRRYCNFPTTSLLAFIIFNYSPLKYVWNDIFYLCEKH